MKKTIALAMLAMMIFSVLSVSVFAKQEKAEKGYEILSAGEAQDNSEQTDKAQAYEEQAKAKKTNLIKAREIAKERIEAAKAKLVKARERYIVAKKEFILKRAEFRKTKSELIKCKKNETSECEQLREQVKIHAREYLLKTADKVINALERIKSRIEIKEDLSEEDAAELIEQINAKIVKMEEAKKTLEESEEKEEIIKAAKQIRRIWRNTRIVMKKAVGRLLHAKIAGILVKAERLETRLEKILNRLEAEGADVSNLKDMLDEFAAYIDSAKAAYEEAKADWIAGNAKEMAKHVRKAHSHLKEAHFVLRDLVVGIRQAKGGEEALKEPEEDVEEEIAEEEQEEE